MSDMEHALPPGGLGQCAPKTRKVYEIDRKDRLLLAASLLWCVLAADGVLLARTTGAGVSATVFTWYVLLFSALGAESLHRRENQALLGVNLLLATFFALSSSQWFHQWNFRALLVLLPVHAWGMAGSTALFWWQPGMLAERLWLQLRGLFSALGAPFAALGQKAEKRNSRRLFEILVGTAAALVLVSILVLVLASADTLFAMVTADVQSFLRRHFSAGLHRLFLGLVLTPFTFSLLYRLRRPKVIQLRQIPDRQAAPLPFLIVLAALAALYLTFLAVQSAGLFGGPEYLAARGINYASWARSGFFQMVGVTVVNLTVMLTSLSAAQPSRPLQILSAILTVESLVLLASAAWRMTLYVSAYGLSFKRCLTYWGMVMMALFFLAALRKVLRPEASFFRWAFPLALAGWLVLNCIPVDGLVARNQVDRYLAGESQTLSVEYLACLSYDTVPQLERLSGTVVQSDWGSRVNVNALLEARRGEAAADCAHWQSWNLSACFAKE